ncbi:hypothetical protein CV102_05020 [Natronococcus pandeyae]|uniref:Uncharacterized protein n=1 Tax=Natronococcus pandeyae TaxID=2055836 RepID=A0A8J8TTG3_9EURY|nr:hypothetical protein [Natronococcus pandeyae]TYL39652.1 hypothetical protein CV102_05020 [Natronococcus pandeyae]
MDETEPIHWRRDADTSRTVRILWSLGVGTFFAAISIIVFWRLFDLAGQTGGRSFLVAALAALIVTTVAVAVSDSAEQHLERLTERLPVSTPASVDRLADAALGAITMGLLIAALMITGRFVSQNELLGGVGAGPFTGLAALTIPLALVALVLASFLRSVGAFDPEDRVIYLYDPDQSIDLDVIEEVSVRKLGDAAIVKLGYAQPDGQYVKGPRRIVVPPHVAREITAAVEASSH